MAGIAAGALSALAWLPEARVAARVASSDDGRLAALVVAAQEGDQRAYQAALRGCVPLAAAVARRRGVPPDRVDDVVQDVLLAVHRALATYDPSRPFLPWLHAIAERRSIDALRLRGRVGSREVHDPIAYEAEADLAIAADIALIRQQDAGRLRAAIQKLPPGQRQAVEILGLQEHSLDEAAGETGRNKVALKVNLHRALRALRKILEDEDV